MARYEITAPDGGRYEINAPDNATEQQIMAYAKQQFSAPQPTNAMPATPADPTESMSGLQKLGAGAGKAFVDLYRGGKQLLRVGDQQALQKEIDESKKLDEPLMNTGAGLAGNVVGNIAATVPTAAIPGAAGVRAGAALNAALSAFQPVATGESRAQNIGIGALTGAAGGAAGKALGRVLNPKTSPEVLALMKEGVTPTPGQIMGGAMARTEEKATSLPLIGDLIKNSQRRGVEDFNRAAYTRALNEIGEKSKANVGRAGVLEVKTKLGDAYNNLLPKLQFKADQQFSQEINQLSNLVKNGNVPPEIAKQFDSIVKSKVFSRMTKQGNMDGISFKELETDLGQTIKRYQRSQSPNDQNLGDALNEVLSSARAVLQRSNPAYAERLKDINKGYANYARIRGAASKVGAQEGVFTPEQLQSAVRALDNSVGKGNFATGKALGQDLSEAAKNVLGSKYPDSGTPGRALMASAPGMAALAYANPLVAALAAGGGSLAALPYTAAGQKLAAALLAKRPDALRKAGDAAEKIVPIITRGVSPYANDF